jgi:hypothetical protein
MVERWRPDRLVERSQGNAVEPALSLLGQGRPERPPRLSGKERKQTAVDHGAADGPVNEGESKDRLPTTPARLLRDPFPVQGGRLFEPPRRGGATAGASNPEDRQRGNPLVVVRAVLLEKASDDLVGSDLDIAVLAGQAKKRGVRGHH